MTPDWLFQVMWLGASIGGGGALWYFLSQRSHHAALWTGFTTVVVVLLAVRLQIRNDLLRTEQQTATAASPERPTLANPSAAITPFVADRAEEPKANLQEKSPAEKKPLSATSPPMSTAQDVESRQVLPDVTSDKVTPESKRPTIREKSAAEILGHLKGITPSYRFREKVEELYRGRWTREPGWQATVHSLPSKLPGGSWFCSLKEVGSGTPVMAVTDQDVSMLRTGDSVTVSGRIKDVSILEDVSLEDAILQGDNVPSH